MNAPFKILAAAVCGLLLGLPAAQAEIPVYVFIDMGAPGNALTMSPRSVTLKSGELYRFVVSNPGDTAHVVAAPELGAKAQTQQLTIGSPRLELYEGRVDWGQAARVALPAGKIISGVDLKPGEQIEWTFTPLAEGVYKFGCDNPAHAAAGMFATVDVIAGDTN